MKVFLSSLMILTISFLFYSIDLYAKQERLIVTESKYDFGIRGNGFFTLIDDNGAYCFTRFGRFYLSDNGSLYHESSNLKLLVKKSLPISEKEQIDLSISNDGFLLSINSNRKIINKGKIYISKVKNPPSLDSSAIFCSDEGFEFYFIENLNQINLYPQSINVLNN